MLEKIKNFFDKHKDNNKILVCCIIISFFILATSFAMPYLKDANSKIKEVNNENIEVELVEEPKEIKSTKNGDTNIGNGGDYDNVKGDYTILGNVQDEGVRVTVVETESNKPVTTPIDFGNNPRQPIQIHFGKVSKLSYLKNNNLIIDSREYVSKRPTIKLPKIINGNLKTIKKYFGNEEFLKNFCNLTGFNYEQLVSGKYKLMLEPVGYPKIAGKVTACTATEIAILDKKMNGAIRKSAIQLFSHLNLPMAMYLERDEFGIKAYKGSTVSKQSNDTIIAQLGVGAITFKDFEEPPPPPVASYVYRTNTEVYTSLQLSGMDWLLYYKDQEIKNPVNVTFNIGGRTYPAINRDIIFPSTGIAYVKWRTPDKPQDMIIKAKVSYKKIDFNQITGSPYIKNQVDEHDIAVKIVELKENPPPNPDADDRNDSFRISKAPKIADDMKENRWYEYSVTKEKEPVYNDEGEWKYDREAWIWTTYEYTAKLGVFLNTYPDPLCKTYRSENWNTYRNSKAKLNKQRILYKMKSGYGIRQRLLVEKRTTVTHLNGDVEDYTQVVSSVGVAPQNAINYFSDFDFKNYFRLSEVTELRRNESILEFKKNRYSTYDNRTHFTPIWYPDNEFYVVNSMVFDAWTPAGQLYLGATTSSGADVKEKGEGNAIFIKGNLWDDWYVQPLPTYGTDPKEI